MTATRFIGPAELTTVLGLTLFTAGLGIATTELADPLAHSGAQLLVVSGSLSPDPGLLVLGTALATGGMVLLVYGLIALLARPHP